MADNYSDNRLSLNIYSIKSRVTFSFLVVGLAVLLLLGLTSYQVYRLVYAKNQLEQTLYSLQINANRLESAIQQTSLALQNHLIDRKLDYEIQRNKLWQTEIKQALDSLETQKSQWISNEMRLKYEGLLINLKKLRVFQDEIAKLIEQENSEQSKNTSLEDIEFSQTINSKKLFETKLLELITHINSEFAEFQELQKQAFNARQEANQLQLSRFWVVGIVLIIILLALITYIGVLLVRMIMRRIRNLQSYVWALNRGNIPQDFKVSPDEIGNVIQDMRGLGNNLLRIKDLADTIGKGDFDTDIRVFDYEGELGKSFAEMHNGLVQVAVRDRQRNWMNEGIALFGNILREYGDAQTLYDELISNLVKYVLANQGAIFILNDAQANKPILELKSVYAYDRKRYQEKDVRPGQGLIGQAWLEKDTLYIEKASEDFVQISSGLGKANPRSLLIVPMISSESVVLGALELASFKTFEEHEIEFVKRISEMIVSAIASLKNNERTRTLLEEAQNATEQLRLQDQEMRLNLTQLMETQAEMLKNQAELSGQTFAINTTLATLEFDLNDTILSANAIFLQSTAYNLEDLRGKSYQKLVDDKVLGIFEYQKFWQELREGKPQQREIRLKNKEKGEVWYNATYTPIRDNQNKIYKIIKLGIEITEQKRSNYEYQNRLEALNQSNPVIEFDLAGYILYVNDLYLNMMGYKLDEIKGKHQSVIVPENERNTPEYLNLWKRLAQGESVSHISQRTAKNGKIIWIQANYNIIRDLDNKPYKVINIAQDITLQKELEFQAEIATQNLAQQKLDLQELSGKMQLQEADLQGVISQLQYSQLELEKSQSDLQTQIQLINNALALVEYNAEGKITYANDNFLQLTKYRLSEIVGMSYTFFLESTDSHFADYQQLWQGISLRSLHTKEVRFLTKDGFEIWFNIILSPLRDKEGNIYKILQLSMHTGIENTINSQLRAKV